MRRRALVFVACTLIVTALLVGLDPFGRGSESTAGSQTCETEPCDAVAVPVGAVGLLALTTVIASGATLTFVVRKGRRGWGPRRHEAASEPQRSGGETSRRDER